MKINMPRILGATLTMIFLSGLVQTAQCAKEVETGTVALKELTPINRVYLLNGDRISGTVISLDKDALFLDCMLSKKLRIDMRAVMVVDFQPKTQQKFQLRKEEMDKVDLINGDKITGDVLSLSGKTITIKGEYGALVLKKEGLSHVVFGLRERLYLGFPKEEKSIAVLKLVNDDTISGKLLNFSDDVFHFTTKYSQDLKIKSQHVSSFTFTHWPETGAAWKRNEGLVAYYPFNGNANDESKHENHGKVTGATLTENRFGNPNSAYNFSGKDNYIDCGNHSSLEITGDMTIEAWIYPISLNYDPDKGIIVKKGDCTHASRDAYYLILGGYSLPADIIFALSDGSSGPSYTAQGVIPSLNNWYHVAATYDRAEGKVRVYVDGVLCKTADRNAPTNPATSHNVFIGREVNQNYSERRFIGKIDEVRLYNRALSETEIQDYYLIESKTGGAKISGDGKWNYYYVSTPAGRLNGQVICGGLNKWKGAPLVSKKSDIYFLINGINRPAEGYYGLGTFLYSPTAIEYSIKTVANDFCALYIDGVLYSQWPIGTAYFTLRLTAGWHRVELALTNTDDPGYTLYWGTVENQGITSVPGVVIDSKKYDDWVSKIAGRS